MEITCFIISSFQLQYLPLLLSRNVYSIKNWPSNNFDGKEEWGWSWFHLCLPVIFFVTTSFVFFVVFILYFSVWFSLCTSFVNFARVSVTVQCARSFYISVSQIVHDTVRISQDTSTAIFKCQMQAWKYLLVVDTRNMGTTIVGCQRSTFTTFYKGYKIQCNNWWYFKITITYPCQKKTFRKTIEEANLTYI